jgi:hypothetical protein
MNGRATIGLVLIAIGALLWFVTPGHVTWGNHHYLRHGASYALLFVGALFLITGSRGR